MTNHVRYLIVGAGVSGLSFAGRIKSDDYLILEKSDAIGGYCKTIKQDGFVWDYSGHFFHFRRPEIEAFLLERMSDDQTIRKVEKDSRIYWKGDHVDFPFQKNIHQLPKEEFIECLYDLYLANESKGDQKPSNFSEMLYAKFGEGIAERFLIPYNEKLYATDLAKLDVDAMGRFFPYADIGDVIHNFKKSDNQSYNSTFTYPDGGAIQYVEALAQEVESAKIKLGQELLSVDLQNKIANTTEGKITFDTLVSSVPFPAVLEMSGIEVDKSVYNWNVVEVFNLGFNKKGPIGPHWIYYPQKELSFYRVGFYDNIFDTERMSMYVELGRTREFEPANPETTLQIVIEDLKKVGVVTNHELVSHKHLILDPAYVHISEQSIEAVSKMKASLSARGVHTIGRYGSWTYCSIEDNIVEAWELADVFNRIGA